MKYFQKISYFFLLMFVLASLNTQGALAATRQECLDRGYADGGVAYNSCISGTGGAALKIDQPGDAITNIPTLIQWAIQLLFVIAGLIAFVYLLLGGIKWITSGGDKGQVETARNQIIQALIGLVVVFAAWGLIILVQNLLDICLGFGCEPELPDPGALRTP